MKLIRILSLFTSSGLVIGGAFGEVHAPSALGPPVGSLTVDPLTIKVNKPVGLQWEIDHRELAADIVDIGDTGALTPTRRVRMRVRVAGVSDSSGGVTALPVAFMGRVGSGSRWSQLFYGDYDQVDPEHYVLDQVVEAGTTVDFLARGQIEGGGWSQIHSTMQPDIAVSVHTAGEPVPAHGPSTSADNIQSFVTQFVTADDRIALGSNEIIFFFELGTDDATASSFDMQDLVVVVTLKDA